MEKNFEDLSLKKESFHTYGEEKQKYTKICKCLTRKIHFQTSDAKKLVTIKCSQ